MPDSRMSHACILAAPSDEECMKMARALAQGILCERGGDEPCGRCEACRKVSADIHPDLITVRRLNDDKGRPRREITVEQIRAVNRDAWVLPNEAARKVYIISEADKMNPAAQNAALKLLEEPPNGAVFLLCASNPSLLLPTVRSRCALRRSPAGENAAGEESLRLAGEYLRAAAEGDRAKLLRWCVAQEGLDQRAAQDFIEALRLRTADMLCGRQDKLGMDRMRLMELASLASRCAEYLRVNTGSKHIFGLLAVDTPLGSGNRG